MKQKEEDAKIDMLKDPKGALKSKLAKVSSLDDGWLERIAKQAAKTRYAKVYPAYKIMKKIHIGADEINII